MAEILESPSFLRARRWEGEPGMIRRAGGTDARQSRSLSPGTRCQEPSGRARDRRAMRIGTYLAPRQSHCFAIHRGRRFICSANS